MPSIPRSEKHSLLRLEKRFGCRLLQPEFLPPGYRNPSQALAQQVPILRSKHKLSNPSFRHGDDTEPSEIRNNTDNAQLASKTSYILSVLY